MSNFLTSLTKRWKSSGSLLCVGLDPDAGRLPSKMSVFEFGCEIIDATAPFACAFKPQIAHYAATGDEEQLAKTIEYIKTRHAGIPVILDAKRGDIGSTAEMYAREAFDRYHADAVTLNPYLGFDALAPFFERSDKGAFLLCRTSNPGSDEFQELQDNQGFTLACQVAKKAQSVRNKHRNIGLVVGATWPDTIAAVRKVARSMPLLIPGIGAQGGDLWSALVNGLNERGDGVLINVSRAILYASSEKDFADAAAREAEKFYKKINKFRPRAVSASAVLSPRIWTKLPKAPTIFNAPTYAVDKPAPSAHARSNKAKRPAKIIINR